MYTAMCHARFCWMRTSSVDCLDCTLLCDIRWLSSGCAGAAVVPDDGVWYGWTRWCCYRLFWPLVLLSVGCWWVVAGLWQEVPSVNNVLGHVPLAWAAACLVLAVPEHACMLILCMCLLCYTSTSCCSGGLLQSLWVASLAWQGCDWQASWGALGLFAKHVASAGVANN